MPITLAAMPNVVVHLAKTAPTIYSKFLEYQFFYESNLFVFG